MSEQATPESVNVVAVLSVVAGAVSLLGTGCCCVPIISYLAMVIVPTLAVLAIVLGSVGLATSSAHGGNGKGLSITGIGLGICTFLVSALIMLMLVGAVGGLVLLDSM